MKGKKGALLVFGGLVAALALVAAGCGGGGDGAKTLKIVSDLPLQGSDLVQSSEMVKAIEFVVEQAGNKAGDYTIEYESFDDATVAAGKWEEAKCTENARTYLEDDSIVGVIGTYNSGCAALIIPILNEAPIAMISPANTGVYLTRKGASTGPGEPEKYYPTGERNYTRVVASDDFQGKAGVALMQVEWGVKSVYILDDKEGYGKGLSDEFEAAAKAAGLKVAGHEGWDPQASNYKSLMAKIKDSGADGIYISGVSTNNGGQLIKDKVAIVGDNTKVRLLVPDGFVLDSIFDEAGAANMEGVYGTAPTQPTSSLTEAGQQFMVDFGAKIGVDPKSVQVYSVYAAAAAQVLLDAIARSDGSRADIVAKMFETEMDTVVGPMKFDANGDPFGGTEQLFKANPATKHWEWDKPLSG
jgi:branched-chain amino acid transport system substrate-binding protein